MLAIEKWITRLIGIASITMVTLSIATLISLASMAAAMSYMTGASLLYTTHWGVLIQYFISIPIAVLSIRTIERKLDIPRKKIYQYAAVAGFIIYLIAAAAWCTACAYVWCNGSMGTCFPSYCSCK